MILKIQDLKVGDIIRPKGSKFAFDDHVVVKTYTQGVDLSRPSVAIDTDGNVYVVSSLSKGIGDKQLVDFVRIRITRTKEVF